MLELKQVVCLHVCFNPATGLMGTRATLDLAYAPGVIEPMQFQSRNWVDSYSRSLMKMAVFGRYFVSIPRLG